jgi:hypothetical protein
MLDRISIELMQPRERLADQRTEQEHAEEEGDPVQPQKSHQRPAMPMEK